MYDRHCREVAELFIEDWASERPTPLPVHDQETLIVALSQAIQDTIDTFLGDLGDPVPRRAL